MKRFSYLVILGCILCLGLAACDETNVDRGPNAGDESRSNGMSCEDGSDNDQDGQIDCADSGCNNFVVDTVVVDSSVMGSIVTADIECEFGQEDSCFDGFDNDGDGLEDCADNQCNGEISEDGRDIECENTEVSCADEFDNDGNGLVDCADDNCSGFGGSDEFDHDNDPDTPPIQVECQDAEGAPITPVLGQPAPTPACADNFDNDGDGRTDCADVQCDGMAGCEFGQELTCGDGSDNDADGNVDCTDSDCLDPEDEDNTPVAPCERVEATCGDGIDNDNDGSTDCDDSDCVGEQGVDGRICTGIEVDQSRSRAEFFPRSDSNILDIRVFAHVENALDCHIELTNLTIFDLEDPPMITEDIDLSGLPILDGEIVGTVFQTDVIMTDTLGMALDRDPIRSPLVNTYTTSWILVCVNQLGTSEFPFMDQAIDQSLVPGN